MSLCFFSRGDRVDRVERKLKLRVELEQWRDKSSALELELTATTISTLRQNVLSCSNGAFSCSLRRRRFCVGTECRFRVWERGKSRRL